YTGVSNDDLAVFGDRLYTDIALGKNHGITSVLVLSGETNFDDVNESNKPDYIFKKLGDIICQNIL
ncbi:MAG: HAD hydrolase-like protein, partial [Clostridia bacterium]